VCGRTARTVRCGGGRQPRTSRHSRHGPRTPPADPTQRDGVANGLRVQARLAGHGSAILRGMAKPATLRGMAASEQRRTELLRGVLDLCLLAVMDEEPAYGYEMTRRLRARGLSAVGEGSIYPLLGRLERDGLVETHRAASNGGPPRKYYRASSSGQRALAAGAVQWREVRDAVDAVLDPVRPEVSR